MYRVVLRVENVPIDIGPQAAVDITNSFKMRPWHQIAACEYINGGLTFTSENDFDDDGLATQDEFAAEFSGSVPMFSTDDGNLAIVSVEKLS